MSRIVTRKIRVKQTREGDLCPTWPRCHCATQGYLNLREKDHCGRKPKTRRIVTEECVD